MQVPISTGGVEPIWQPQPEHLERARITRFAAHATARYQIPTRNYRELWQWSVDRPDQFWRAVWEFFDLHTPTDYTAALTGRGMPGAQWFPGAQLNYAEHALRAPLADEPAVIWGTEDGKGGSVTWAELRAEVGAFAAWLRNVGVAEGDRVVGYLPNGPHAVTAFLAAASIGAVWSVCGPDYGADGAAARFGQLTPAVLVAADGYWWNGRQHDRRAEVRRLRELLPSLRASVLVPHLGLDGTPDDGMTSWSTAAAEAAVPQFRAVAFDAPLWVLFSSGTTGVPKGIVHGHGGVVLDHCKLLGLHFDLGLRDRFCWYTTTSWMMWNMVVSGLLVGATVLLYDGSPVYPTPARLFELAAEHRAGVLGVSPGYLLACAKAQLRPGTDLDLGALRILGSTGSPLPADSYVWVRDRVGPQVQVASTTGGTDVVSGFAGSAPNLPVWPGELSAPLLGVALDAWDAHGNPVLGEVGELVVTQPMPTMPLRFWNDPDGSAYRAAYFAIYDGVWRHGDWIVRTERGSVIVSGRSDSTLNRQGVRLGSADIYAVVEKLPDIQEALVIGVELADGGYWLPLFVVLRDGVELDDELRHQVAHAIRTQASPRHVPDEIIAVPAIPHTRTAKKLEVPVKRLIQGAPLEQIASADAVDEPEALRYFARFARR